MPNIVKGFYIVFFSLFLSISGRGQVYMNHNYSLWNGSANGEIHTTYEDTLNDIYILGGYNLVNLGGTNIGTGKVACLNKSDFSINWTFTNQLSFLAAEVNDIAVHRETYEVVASPDNYQETVTRLYVVGRIRAGASNEYTITRKYIDTTNIFGSTGYQISNWYPKAYGREHNDLLTNFGYAGLDAEIVGDTIVFVGKFNLDSNEVYGVRKNVVAFNVKDDSWIPGLFSADSNGYNDQYFSGYPHFTSSNPDTSMNFAGKIKYFDDKYYLIYDESKYGFNSAYVQAYDNNGNKLNNTQYQFDQNSGMNTGIWDFEILKGNDTCLVYGRNFIDSADHHVIAMDGSEYTQGGSIPHPFADHHELNPNFYSEFIGAHEFLQHKNKLFAMVNMYTGWDLIRTYDLDSAYPMSPDTMRISTWVNSASTFPAGIIEQMAHIGGGTGSQNMEPSHVYENMHIVGNMLFLSHYYLGWADGHSTPGGLAMWCLEPDDLTTFETFDTTVCQGDTVDFITNKSNYAEKYEWSYSGNGVDFLEDSFGDTSFFEADSNHVRIRILENFTPGTLTVTPYTTCYGLTDNGEKVYSNQISINIGTNPLPNANAGLDTIINCFNNETVTLIGQSDTAGVTYSWNKLISPFFSFQAGQNFPTTEGNTFVLRVERPNGCLAFDTVFVDIDTIKPTFDPVPSQVLGCGDTIYFLGHCNNATDTTSWWEKSGDITQLTNPLECTTPGIYNFYTINNQNGCLSQLSPNLNVPLSGDLANIEITGYDSIPPLGIFLDTLNCSDPTLTLMLYSDTAGATLNWVDSDTLNPSGGTQIVSAAGVYYIEAYNPNSNCYNYAQVFIDIDTLSPTVIIDNPSTLNCSNSSVNLNGTVYPDYVLQWDGNSIPSSPNPVTVSVSEYYTLTISDTSNGCVNQDSVFVIQNNSIDILTSNDTVVCDQFVANVSASYVGTITGITYLWDNSETTPNATYTGGDDDYAIIEIFGDAGCYGTDTVFISIPPTPVMEFTGYQPCGSPTSGYIVVNPISGWAPFDYSTDGGTNYQSSATLSGLNLGTHTVTVRDSLNCEYDFPASISETSSIATPEFLFQTYNYQSDTVIVIDVSNPATDSVDWYFSPEIILLDENNGSPIIILPDTGSFQITMDAYYGTCISSITKEIFVSELDTNSANPYNDNGIKSIGLYPNPTSGTFTVEVEFFNSQTASLSIQDMLGYVYDFEEYPESLTISQTFTMAGEIDNGTYILRVLSEFDSAYITFILNR